MPQLCLINEFSAVILISGILKIFGAKNFYNKIYKFFEKHVKCLVIYLQTNMNDHFPKTKNRQVLTLTALRGISLRASLVVKWDFHIPCKIPQARTHHYSMNT